MHPRDAAKEIVKAVDEADRLADHLQRNLSAIGKCKHELSLVNMIRVSLGTALSLLKDIPK